MDKPVADSSPILQKYLGAYKRNSNSRVFAPLAEVYRKNGKISDAFRVLEKGIALHPTYIMGHLCLAKCFFDLGQYDRSYSTLLPFVSENFDNISLQKIFAESCLNLGHKDEALNTYKHLLYLNPKDREVSSIVQELEEDLQSNLIHKISPGDSLPINKLKNSDTIFDDVDDWVQVDFVSEDDPAELNLEEEIVAVEPIVNPIPDIPKESSADSWEMVDSFSDKLISSSIDQIDEDDQQDLLESKSSSPLMSHTLVDLYCAQKYYDKAIDLLEKILELNPADDRTRQKLLEVERLNNGDQPEALIIEESKVDEEGHDDLMRAYDERFSEGDNSDEDIDLKDIKLENLKEKYQLFMVEIRKKADLHG